MARYKHLSLSERYTIQEGLARKKSLRSIALRLGRDTSTISKEIKKHAFTKRTGGLGRPFNNCKHRFKCKRSETCPRGKCPGKSCGACGICIQICPTYEKEICLKQAKAPYVCNGCDSMIKCTLEKRIYSAAQANQDYKLTLRELRQGLCVSEEDIKALDKVISPLLKKGHSIHHICASNPGEIMFSERTIYNYMDLGLFSASNIDMPRKVRFRARKSSHDSFKIDRACRIGRTFDDYLSYLEEHPDTSVVQMDSVVGEVGGKLLLTIHFVKAEFMLAFLRDRNTAASVAEIFNHIYEALGYDTFTRLFPIILCDNGSEFSDPTSIEVDSDGAIRTHIFYCNPSAPYQKGSIENNHEFIRRIVPKGKSMNGLTQEKVNLMMSHINSYKRENLGDKSPSEVFKFFFGQDTLEKLGITEIPANDVLLKPILLK